MKYVTVEGRDPYVTYFGVACSACGSSIMRGATFCANCGRKLTHLPRKIKDRDLLQILNSQASRQNEGKDSSNL